MRHSIYLFTEEKEMSDDKRRTEISKQYLNPKWAYLATLEKDEESRKPERQYNSMSREEAAIIRARATQSNM